MFQKLIVIKRSVLLCCYLMITFLGYAQSWKELDDKGTELFEQGKFDEAFLVFEQARKQAEKEFGKNHPNYALACNNLAGPYLLQGDYLEAEGLFLEAQEIRARLGLKGEEYAVSCNGLGLVYLLQGRLSKAELSLIEAKDITEKLFGKENISYGKACENLAGVYLKQGRYPEAEALFLEAKKIIEREFGKNHLEYATICNNLALVYDDQGKYPEAATLLLEAREVYEKILGKNHQNYAQANNNLAGIYTSQGKYMEAEQLFLESKNICEKVLGKEHTNYALVCYEMAKLYEKQQKYSEAEVLFLEAKSIREKVLGKSHQDYSSVCNALGRLYWAQKKYPQANTNLYEASQTLIQLTKDNFYTLSEREKEQFLHTFKDDFEIYNNYTLATNQSNISGWLYDNILIIKGLLFRSTQRIQNIITRTKNPELIQIYQKWKQQRKKIAKISEMSLEEKKEIDIDKEEAKANELEKQLSTKSESFAGELDNKIYRWKDVQAKLKPGEAVIEIVRFRYYPVQKQVFTDSVLYLGLILTSQSSHPTIVILPDGNKIEKSYFNHYRRAISKSNQELDTVSYSRFWQPFVSHLKGIQKVYFSSDGVFHKINLLTLYNSQTKKYLLSEIEIQLLGNSRDIITMNRIAAKKLYKEYQVYLFGFPDYSGKNNSIKNDSFLNKLTPTIDRNHRFFSENGGIAELPGTKTEIENIQKTINNHFGRIFLDSAATEENIKQVTEVDILHIATHGFFSEDPTKTILPDDRPIAQQSALERSGLLLANAGLALAGKQTNKTENGILTAQEAMEIDLVGTDLTVLSACETGLGEIKNGEGVYGLQRAFYQAGSKTIVMSLWKVDDAATQEMMSLFYQNLFLKNQTKRTAFNNAQKALREKYPTPYYWGAFVMIGE